MEEGNPAPLIGGAKQWWLGLLAAGVFVAGLGVFLWITARQNQPVVEVISRTEGEETGLVGQIVVDVSGAVNVPGIYVFNANSRVEAALTAAGGVNDQADFEWLEKNINRADKLIDGMKIYIPKKKSATSGEVSGVETENCVSLNEASSVQLEELPGVGPATAEKIIAGRPYSTVSELKEKKIVGEKVYAEIEKKVCLW